MTPEETDYQEDLDILDRKVKEVTLASPDLLVSLLPHGSSRRETTAILAPADYQASPDLEVTKVFPVCLVVKASPDFLVFPSRVKASPECLDSLVPRDPQATPDPRERPESMVSPESLDKEEMMVLLVCLVILESLVALVAKVFPVNRTVIQEAPVSKASPEIQASQVGVGSMVLVEMMASQEVQVFPEQRVQQENPEDQELQALPVSLVKGVFKATQEREEQRASREVLEVLGVLELKVYPVLLVWMDLTDSQELRDSQEHKVQF